MGVRAYVQAFCESDAATPHEVQARWISWDGFEWHSSPSLRFVEPAPPGLQEEDSDYEEEMALEARFVNEHGEGQLSEPWPEAPGQVAGPQQEAERPAGDNGAADEEPDEPRQGRSARHQRARANNATAAASRSRMCAVM